MGTGHGTATCQAYLRTILASPTPSPEQDRKYLKRRHLPMGKARGDFADILLKKGILEAEQVAEARTLQQQTGAKLQDALVKLGYISQDEIMSAIADPSGLKSINLTDLTIPPAIIELV